MVGLRLSCLVAVWWLCPPLACVMISSRYTRYGFKFLIAAIVIIGREQNTCECFKAYFPMTAVKLQLPINEKSQSIFSKIPIGQFQVVRTHDNSIATEYIYSLEENSLLGINSSTGEVFMKNDYQRFSNKTSKYLITAISRNILEPHEFPHMTFELKPIVEEEFCRNLENICFWSSVHYHIVEDYTGPDSSIEHRKVGSLVPHGAKYLCPYSDVKYSIAAKSPYFTLKNNELFSTQALDHEALNTSDSKNLLLPVKCQVKLSPTNIQEFQRVLTVTVGDRNDNGPSLQNNETYHFELADPHFKANLSIGDKIIFLDRDAMATNAHQTYKIYNDTSNLVRAVCNSFEADHTGKRNSIISCQIIFSRNGILSQSPYCFTLEASDSTVDKHVANSARANICLHTDPKKIHEFDRPRAMALRSRQNRKYSTVVNSEETILDSSDASGGRIITQSVYNTYPKDVYVYRTAMMYSRVTQPTPLMDLIRMPEVRYTIVEDRTGAFDITPVAGILYVKDPSALERSLETVYFVNVSWSDTHQRSFVINVHLTNGRPSNTSCDFKIKSRSQTCGQIKYQKHCETFCGLASNGGSCEWRGSNDAVFSKNYASCVPNATHCPDNVCDPLEELNAFICPQDCAAGNRIMGPHSVNDNRRGIYTASGTCTCEDNGKCSCAPLDSDEPKQKRKRTKGGKNDVSTNSAVMEKDLLVGGKASPVEGLNVAGFVCGKSCMIIGITSPVVFVVLLICLIVSRRNIKRKSLGKMALTYKKGSVNQGAGECDVLNGDLPLMPLENGFKFEAVDSVWEFEREKLILDVVLGEGEFGKVFKGYATDIAGVGGVTTVAVKMLKNGANSVEYMALLSEFQLLQEVSHPNVIKLLGACTKGDSPMIIIEYARYGSLRNYLRLSRKIECAGVDFTDGIEPVNVKNILTFAWQICKGMAYLTEIKLVHRDLAARNVLLADGKICKVSDFGLTRDVYEDDAYLKRSRDRVPVKWMAPESLADHVYTTKSDVWAFGVLCWELITLGASPYPGVPPQNLYHLLKSGYRMERPENTSEEVYAIIRSCWTDDPNARPSFKYLASQFEKLLGNNAKYIELETNAISNPLYCSSDLKSRNNTEEETTKLAYDEVGTPDCLEHLWRPPKISYDLPDWSNSRELSATFSAEFLPPPGYDMPRPLIEACTTEQALRYENDLRFPLNIRKSIGDATCATSPSLKGGNYEARVKRGRSYMDMTNKTHIPDNLDNSDFEKHISKTISFRFSSLLNLQEHEQEQNVIV